MNPRELLLLSPYRVPAQHSQMLGNEDTAAFLNAYTALWHPAVLQGAAGPPQIASPYDHEQPTAGHIYAIPESPPLILPDDWDQRVVDAGAIAFRATADRETTLNNLKEALEAGVRRREAGEDGGSKMEDGRGIFYLPSSVLHPPSSTLSAFFGIGLGYVMVTALFEAMEHENVLATSDLWQDVQAAVAALSDPDPEAYRRHLQSAADRLMTAREVLYPVTIHILDLCLLGEDQLGAPLPAAFDQGMPINLIAAASLLEKLAQENPERLAAIRERLQSEQLEVCGGPYREREDALLPVESQLWNLLKGQATYRELLGSDVRVFARKRFSFHPQLPLLLQSVGIQKAVLLAFDASAVPTYRSTTINWPSPDGKQVEAFTRTPQAADNPQT